MPPKSKSSSVTAHSKFNSAHNLWSIQAEDVREILDDNPTFSDVHDAFEKLKGAYDNLKISAAPVYDRVTDEFDAAREEYHNTRKEVNRYLEQNKPVSETPKKVSNDGQSTVSSHAHLKKIDSPKWDGTIRSYPRFKNNFKELVQNHISQEISLIRLREEALEKDSRGHLLVRSRSNIDDAWKALDQAFGRANTIRDAVMRDINELEQVSEIGDAEGLRNLVMQLISAKEDLKACQRVSALGDNALSSIMEKIPSEIRREIDRKILEDDLDSGASFDLLIKELETAASVEEMHSLRSCANPYSPQAVNNASKALQMSSNNDSPSDSIPRNLRNGQAQRRQDDSGNGKNKRYDSFRKKSGEFAKGEKTSFCVLHADCEHRTSECRVFLGKSAMDKKKLIGENKLCYKCFGDHDFKECRSPHMCMEVDCEEPGSHHTMIHAACMSQVLASSITNVVREPKNNAERKQLAHALGSLTVRPSHFVYLRQKRKGKPKLIEAAILYDNGATLSQILNSVAEKVGLEPVNKIKALMMKTAGKAKSENWGEACLYNVPLFDEVGTLVAVLNCVGVDYIGEHDGGTYDQVKAMFINDGLDPSALLKPVDGTIQILVGNNHAGQFPCAIKSRGDVVWAESLFGEILHGSHETFFPTEANANGMLLSSILDISAGKAVSYLMTSKTKSPFFTVKARSQEAHVCITTAESTLNAGTLDNPQASPPSANPCQQYEEEVTVKARSSELHPASSSSTEDSSPAKAGKVHATKIAEETAFDRMCAIEDATNCHKCQCPTGPQISREEERRREIYRSCLDYDAEKKIFHCRMPWKQNFQELPDNRESAVRRLMSLTKSMSKEPHLRDWYVKEFEKIIDAGILIKVSEHDDKEWKENGGKVFYVCHFAHLNESSASTPLRVVFDPTVPFRGIRLGDLWEHPPNLIPPIPMLLLRFQERRVPIAMDISKCYWTLYLQREESELHRVVWNKLDAEASTNTFRMLRNSWGMRPSGSLCTVAMLQIAEMHREKYPHVYEFVRDNVYVDDGTSSTDDVESAISLAKDISFVLGEGSFIIKHFIIGGKSVDIGQDAPAHVRKPAEQERVLGVIYHSESDEISICARINFSKKRRGARSDSDVDEVDFDEKFPVKFTLRMYLSIIAMIYDPTGICSAFTIVLKFQLGKIFGIKPGWDTALPDECTECCKGYIRAIYQLKKLRFARCLTPDKAVGNPTLVIFSDSSQTAYACVAYYNWQLSTGERQSVLASAKAKPWPKSPQLTIPKGEMMGCILAVRMKKSILDRSSYNFDSVIFITDSAIVCGQMLHSPSKYNVWTANRLDELQSLSEISHWFHIRSGLNVSDLATRGLNPADMDKFSVWQRGPDFMKNDIGVWPITPCDKINLSKEHQSVDVRLKDPRMDINFGRHPSTMLVTQIDNDETDLLNLLEFLDGLRISHLDENDRWVRAKRRIARLIRFLENSSQLITSLKTSKKKLPENFQSMTSSEKSKFIRQNDQFVPTKREMTIAALYLVRCAQKLLPDVTRTLQSLNPVCDMFGVWRVLGRTSHAKENPLVLIPKEHALAKVLVRHYHTPQHSGSDSTLARLRQEFWITGGLRFCNSFVSRCSFCRMMRKQIAQVQIAPRKLEQLLRSPVFENVTIDLAGPYVTKADRRTTRGYTVSTGKIWIMIIVCRVSQACHLELMEAYDTDAFLTAFNTFVQIRGKPKSVVADMGSQIRCASGVIQTLWNFVKIPQLQNHDPENITWTFVPSGAHSFLGQAERSVQIFKRAMEAVTHSRKPELTKIHFQRLLYCIANIMNDRPIGVHRVRVSKLDGDRLLRPNDLILGRSTSDVTPLITVFDESEHTRTLSINEKMVDIWWNKWYELIFDNLLPREKWTRPGRQIQSKDIVLIKQSGAIRNTWTWGEVHDVQTSSDGIVRKATVRYKPDMNSKSKSKYVVKSVRDLCVILQSDERESGKSEVDEETT